jgi:16S rRNA G966 N2-methylase RsmD
MTAPKIVMPSQIVMRATASLIGYARNSRTHSPESVRQLADNIERFGWTQPVLIDGNRGVIAGHGRLMAADLLGLVEVPCIELRHLTDDQKRALVIWDNRSAELSDWSEALLAQELADLSGVGIEATDLGFDSAEVDRLMEIIGKDFGEKNEGDPDAVPEAPVVPTSKLGDVWLLGKHRVMCGDSTDRAQVERLMDGEKADMVFTDPPYGISYDNMDRWGDVAAQSHGLTRRRGKMILGDNNDFDPSFISSMFDYCDEVFVWGMQYYPHKLGAGGVIVWNRKTETQQDVPHADFELCWSKQRRNKMCWIMWGGFQSKEQGEDRLHTTQKPIALAEWFFDRWGRNRRLVVDLFGGSGSTLMACEKTGREARLMELDPAYVDVIVRRWQDFTGQPATLDGDGRTFAEIAEAR